MKKSNKYISFSIPKIGKEEIKEVVDSLKSGWITTGPKVLRFENIIKDYTGSKHALSLNSCTAGLHTSLISCGIKPGDEVITSPLTFAATANTIIHVGATPVFVDIKRETVNIDEDLIEKAITNKTKAIIPVHMAGRPCEMDKIMKIAKKHKLYVIEDAAQAIGAEYKGKKIGSIGDMTCFSFYATKNITTSEGGIVTTNNPDWAEKIKIYRLHGMSKDAWKRYSSAGYQHYDIIYPGFKYNMTDLQAALGIQQMAKINEFDKTRKMIWDAYDNGLKDLPVKLPHPCPSHIKHARHLYTLLIEKEEVGIDRDEFIQKMHEFGIGTSVHFIPLHLHSYYKNKFGYKKGDYPNAEYIGERTVSIPLTPSLTKSEVERIIKTIKKIIRNLN